MLRNTLRGFLPTTRLVVRQPFSLSRELATQEENTTTNILATIKKKEIAIPVPNTMSVRHTHSSSIPPSLNVKKSKKTTGWTEETRNQFHPGDIITALRCDFTGYSPHNALGLTELVCHFHEGRESCQRHIREDGAIMGFMFNVLPRAALIVKDLREQFPEIAAFADSLNKRDLKELFKSEDKINALTAEIEEKFGKSIEVLPRVTARKENAVSEPQSAMKSMWARKGKTVITTDSSKIDENQPSSLSDCLKLRKKL